MAPKKDKGKGGDEAASKAGGAFTEVEKTFLELQITECNRKIARLRTAVDEYEQRNEELQKAYEKLDEDRADIIAYLKKTLNLKSEENSELKDKVKGLEQMREIETAQFKETVNELESNFNIMKDQLTSENKLLAGKLNTLEEFRSIRDDLMRKFERQEEAFNEQEMKYKRIIYDAEKKFIIGKDKLKKEMEARLLQLAQDFQDATELRIAASTHRVIRENISINNELDNLLATQAKLAEQNEKYKNSERAARVAKELAEEERDKAINKSVVQLRVIDQLTTVFQEIKKDKALFEKRNVDLDLLQAQVQQLTKNNEDLTMQLNILKRDLHARMSDQTKSSVESSKIIKEVERLRTILKDAAFAIQASLKIEQLPSSDPARNVMDRQALLSRLLDIVTQYRDIQRAESHSTIASFEKVYEEGDLGFIPKPVGKKSAVSTATSFASKQDKESVPAEIQSSTSVSSSSFGSLKTIPSINILPPKSVADSQSKSSLESFIPSTKSKDSSVAEEEKPTHSDFEQQLEASKIEIQKSIMKDLAYSQVTWEIQASSSQERTSKSVVIVEHKETEDVRVESEHKKDEQVESEKVKDEKVGEEVKKDKESSEEMLEMKQEEPKDVKETE